MAPSITKGIAPGDDSDLEDLIAKPRRSTTSVEIDSAVSSPLGCIGGFFSLCCYTCPRLSKCALILVVIGFVGYLSNTLFNPTKTMGIMGADYSAIKKIYDLSLSKVDHWCIRGDNDSCRCEDPLEATPRAEFKAWTAAHNANHGGVAQIGVELVGGETDETGHHLRHDAHDEHVHPGSPRGPDGLHLLHVHFFNGLCQQLGNEADR